MVSDGGATSGYCSIGSARMAMKPASRIPSETTQAKIGRQLLAKWAKTIAAIEKRYGVPGEIPENEAIPLLCREA